MIPAPADWNLLLAIQQLAETSSRAVELADAVVTIKRAKPLQDSRRALVNHRLELSQKLLEFVVTLDLETEIGARTAISRSYYAVHHAIRALIVEHSQRDCPGYSEAIEFFCKIVSKSASARLHFPPGAVDWEDRLGSILESRHLADYHVYMTRSLKSAPLDQHGLRMLAMTVLQEARDVFERCRAFILSVRKSG